METSDFAAGEVVVVPFPYADQLAEKRRPALVVSNLELANAHGLIWVVMITSAKNSSRDDDIALPLAHAIADAVEVARRGRALLQRHARTGPATEQLQHMQVPGELPETQVPDAHGRCLTFPK